MEQVPNGLSLKTEMSELAIFATRVSNLRNRATKVSSHVKVCSVNALEYICKIPLFNYSSRRIDAKECSSADCVCACLPVFVCVFQL